MDMLGRIKFQHVLQWVVKFSYCALVKSCEYFFLDSFDCGVEKLSNFSRCLSKIIPSNWIIVFKGNSYDRIAIMIKNVFNGRIPFYHRRWKKFRT